MRSKLTTSVLAVAFTLWNFGNVSAQESAEPTQAFTPIPLDSATLTAQLQRNFDSGHYSLVVLYAESRADLSVHERFLVADAHVRIGQLRKSIPYFVSVLTNPNRTKDHEKAAEERLNYIADLASESVQTTDGAAIQEWHRDLQAGAPGTIGDWIGDFAVTF